MYLTDLNNDVLLSVLENLDSASLHSLILTCRDARALAIPFLLQEVTLCRGWDQIHAFCRFIVADIAYRAPLVRVLRLSSQHTVMLSRDETKRFLSPKALRTIPVLRRFMKAACNLHTVSVSSTIGILMTIASIGIQAAILQAPRLAKIVVEPNDDINHTCHRLQYCPWEQWTGRQGWFRAVGQMHSLRTIELSAIPGATLHSVLEPHRNTLERLVMRGDLNPTALPPESQYLRVRTLALHSFATREMLVRAFPNVDYLLLAVNSDGRAFYSHHISDVNLASETCWAHLDHVRGNSLGIMSMVLKCRVRRLDIDLTHMPQVLCIAPQYDFLDLLKVTRPAILSLRMPSWFTTSCCRNVAAAVPSLKGFNLDMYYDDRVSCDVRYLLVMFLANTMVDLRSLVYLSIRIHHPPPELLELPSTADVREMVVTQLGACLPSLQYLELLWKEAGWQPSWWRKVHLELSSTDRPYAMLPLSSSFGLSARRRCMDLLV